jgi:hypothetical protein
MLGDSVTQRLLRWHRLQEPETTQSPSRLCLYHRPTCVLGFDIDLLDFIAEYVVQTCVADAP